jgi:hypothetical protein
MDELIAIRDDSNEGSLDVNINLMDITFDDDSSGNAVPGGEGALVAVLLELMSKTPIV